VDSSGVSLIHSLHNPTREARSLSLRGSTKLTNVEEHLQCPCSHSISIWLTVNVSGSEFKQIEVELSQNPHNLNFPEMSIGSCFNGKSSHSQELCVILPPRTSPVCSLNIITINHFRVQNRQRLELWLAC
jgi:hypothetical protein